MYDAVLTGLAWLYDAHPLMFVLIVFSLADIATGILVSINRRELASKIAGEGINRKLGMMIMVAVSYAAQQVIPNIPLGALACCLHISKEGLSLIENMAILGVPVPDAFVDVMEKINQKHKTSPKRAKDEIRLQSAEIKTDSLVVKSRDTDTTDTIHD